VTFRYAIAEASRAVLTIEHRVRGRRRTRSALVGTVVRRTAAGQTRIRFRLRTKGTYRATLVATDAAGNISLPRSVRFKVRGR
jgi:hypothetical protein